MQHLTSVGVQRVKAVSPAVVVVVEEEELELELELEPEAAADQEACSTLQHRQHEQCQARCSLLPGR